MNTEKFSAILDLAGESLGKYEFYQTQALTETEKEATAIYEGERGTLKMVYAGEKLSIFNESEKRIMYALLPEDASDKDVKFIAGQLTEILDEKFAVKTVTARKNGNKAPQTVSKAAVKAGSFYDGASLAKKLCLIYPELRTEYENNFNAYGEFLPEDFFVNYATPKIIQTINENRPATMKKLFQILNEMYEDGTNDLQSLIAVTILGELNNDQILLARCVDYMSETMAPPVIEVNKFLATRSGKKARAKLANPPAYKPKKAKKPGIMDRLMGAQPQGLNNNQ